MMTPPEPQHAWLKKLVGEWTYEGEALEPGKPAFKFGGTETVRMLGELWYVAEGRGTMPDGTPVGMITTIGYDPSKKKFVGTWIGSMMTHMWAYEAELQGNSLPLETTGPSCTDPTKTTRYRDTITVEDADHRTLTSAILGDDGRWAQFMTCRYTRKAGASS